MASVSRFTSQTSSAHLVMVQTAASHQDFLDQLQCGVFSTWDACHQRSPEAGSADNLFLAFAHECLWYCSALLFRVLVTSLHLPSLLHAEDECKMIPCTPFFVTQLAPSRRIHTTCC